MTYTVTREIHPNNETRLTLLKTRAKKPSLKQQAAEILGVAASSIADLASSAQRSALPLTFVSNSEPTPITCRAHAYARTSFGINARRRISRAAGACDRHDSDITNFLFLTATLPGDTDEAKWGIANHSDWIIDTLKSWLSKRSQSRIEFYVWEHQSRGALHFHYCIHMPDLQAQAEIKHQFKRQWVRLLDGVETRFGVNLWGKHRHLSTTAKTDLVQARVETVYKSVGAYMAGYLAGEGDKHEKDKTIPYYPKRWFGVSRDLSALIKTHTAKSVTEMDSHSEALQLYEKNKEDLLDEVLTTHNFLHKVGEGKTAVFYHTREKQQELWLAKKMQQFTLTQSPNAYYLTRLMVTCYRDLRTLYRSSRVFRAALSPNLQGCLEDSILWDSLARGTCVEKHFTALESLALVFNSISVTSPVARNLSSNLRTFLLAHSHYFPQLRFNKYETLTLENDLTSWDDFLAKSCYARTSVERCSDTVEVANGSLSPQTSTSSPKVEQCRIWD